MAHFAKIDANTHRVIQVVVIGNDEVDYNGDPKGEDYCVKLFNTQLHKHYWKQTSYNTAHGEYYTPNNEGVERVLDADQGKAFRKNYASRGMFYDSNRDAFYREKQTTGMTGWIFNEDKCAWVPPAPQPTAAQSIWAGSGASEEGLASDQNGDRVYVKWDDATQGWTGITDYNVELRWDSATEKWIA